MKTFELEILEYNNASITESKLKRIVNEALKSYSAGQVIRVKEVIKELPRGKSTKISNEKI